MSQLIVLFGRFRFIIQLVYSPWSPNMILRKPAKATDSHALEKCFKVGNTMCPNPNFWKLKICYITQKGELKLSVNWFQSRKIILEYSAGFSVTINVLYSGKGGIRKGRVMQYENIIGHRWFRRQRNRTLNLGQVRSHSAWQVWKKLVLILRFQKGTQPCGLLDFGSGSVQNFRVL